MKFISYKFISKSRQISLHIFLFKSEVDRTMRTPKLQRVLYCNFSNFIRTFESHYLPRLCYYFLESSSWLHLILHGWLSWSENSPKYFLFEHRQHCSSSVGMPIYFRCCHSNHAIRPRIVVGQLVTNNNVSFMYWFLSRHWQIASAAWLVMCPWKPHVTVRTFWPTISIKSV